MVIAFTWRNRIHGLTEDHPLGETLGSILLRDGAWSHIYSAITAFNLLRHTDRKHVFSVRLKTWSQSSSEDRSRETASTLALLNVLQIVLTSVSVSNTL